MNNSKNKRYYLHRKVKDYGAIVHSQKRMIEMEEQLFRYPSPLLRTYLHKLKKLGYEIQSFIK